METSSSSIVKQLGAGSGIDTSQLATNLAKAQFELRSKRLTQQSEKLDSQISAASSLRNLMTKLASALGERVRQGDLASKPSIVDGSVAKVSKAAGTPAPGGYTLEVESLAKGQILSSKAYSSASDAVGSGTLTIRFGQTDGTTFTEDTSKTPANITIPSGAKLSDVASAINDANVGVTAYVAQTADGAKLVYKGADGAKSGFIIQASEAAGEPGLSGLAWDPNNGGQQDKLLTASSDAVFRLDGLQRTSASNTVNDIAPGLSLELTATNAGKPTKIGYSNPSSAISTAMQDIVGALNEVVEKLNIATKAQTGELAGDMGARSLRRSLQGLAGAIIMPGVAEGGTRTLSDLGLKIERDGKFAVDKARLDRTLANDPEGAAAMFTNGLHGVFATVDKLARQTSSTSDPGSLAGSEARYKRLKTDISERTTKLAEQQAAVRSRLFNNLAKADIRVASSQATLTFLKNQIAAWNGSNN